MVAGSAANAKTIISTAVSSATDVRKSNQSRTSTESRSTSSKRDRRPRKLRAHTWWMERWSLISMMKTSRFIREPNRSLSRIWPMGRSSAQTITRRTKTCRIRISSHMKTRSWCFKASASSSKSRSLLQKESEIGFAVTARTSIFPSERSAIGAKSLEHLVATTKVQLWPRHPSARWSWECHFSPMNIWQMAVSKWQFRQTTSKWWVVRP